MPDPESNPGRTWRRGARLLGSVYGVFLFTAVSILAAFLLTPGGGTLRIPYDEASLGEVATSVVKADRDFDLPNLERTDRERAAARDAVLVVYDYDPSVVQDGLARIASAFSVMQEVAPAPDQLRELEDPKRKPGRRDEPTANLVASYAPLRAELQRRLETTLDDESFAALAEARFSPEVQREATRLYAKANTPMVADYRDPLTVEMARGIVVRQLAYGQPGPDKVLTELSTIRDQDEVRAEAATWQSLLPRELSPALRRAIVSVVVKRVRANLRLNSAETEDRQRAAYESVPAVITRLKRGEKIIGDGERIERRHLAIFDAIREQSQDDRLGLTRVGAGLFAALVIAVSLLFARRVSPRWRPTRKDLAFGGLWLVTSLAAADSFVIVAEALHDHFPSVPAQALVYAIPFAAGAILLRLVQSVESAAVFAVVFSALAGAALRGSFELSVVSLLGSAVGIVFTARAKDRAALFKAGLAVGLVGAAAALVLAVAGGKGLSVDDALAAFAALVGGALGVPMLVMGLTPLVESAFRYTTDIRLLELANLNHPALKELIVQAPGTYHHSIVLGSLVEAAAEAIGANPLLARVSAYYHDLGKGKNPLWFYENQRGAESKHEKIAPVMSATVIKRHVTDGLELARRYKLPRQVADAIPQHHGTRLIGYFFHKALQETERQGGKGEPVDEAAYRYAGPKPQTREAALVMLGDSVEASSRTLPDPTPANLKALVQKMLNDIFADGQLDECDLTLRDLNAIGGAFTRTLEGIYHSRPEYPQAVTPIRPSLESEAPAARSRSAPRP